MFKEKEIFKSENIIGILFFIFAFTFPMYSSKYVVDNFTNFYIVIIMSLSLSLIWGFTGIFSFGQAAFYGIGAYTYGIVSLMNNNGNFTLLGIIMGILVPFIVAGILGYFMFYGGVSDIFIGIITMCVSIALQTFMIQTSGSEWSIAGVQLGGYNGLNNIPCIQIGKFSITGMTFYFLVIAIVMVIYLIFRRLEKSKWGYTLYGVRESKMRSELFGYNTAKIQTIVFAISGAIAGLGGVLFAAHNAYVVPETLSVSTSTLVVIMVATAGRKNVTGAVLMTLLYSWFSQYLATTGSQYSQIILGILLLIVIVFLPDGIVITLFKKFDSIIEKLLSKKWR